MTVHEHPLERLNYRNGQRLEALDYRAEQAYHMAVRRWLNRSLYTPGIAKGLEVTAKTKHTVEVAPGLALDVWGREIILVEPREVVVVGTPSTSPGLVFGNYLVVEYGEERTAPTHEACGCDLTWGGPTRIRAVPALSFQDSWPSVASGRVILGQVELKAGCEIVRIHTGIRKYVGASKPPKTQPISLEGEKDIDKDNPKVLYFHIEGSYPDSAKLYLRGAQFSTLYYTELGKHTHASTVTLTSVTHDLTHQHTVGGGQTDPAGEHGHNLWVDDNGGEWGGVDSDHPNHQDARQILPAPAHHHTFANFTTNPAGAPWTHTHTATGAAGDAGATDASARTGASLEHIQTLRIVFDGLQDVTAQVLAQLQGQPGQAANWAELGDGTVNHTLVTAGTGPIDLLQLSGVDLSPGQHVLSFQVSQGGGQLHYNLYVA